MGRAAAWALVIGLFLCALAGFWVGGELHYGNCLTENPVPIPKSRGVWAPEEPEVAYPAPHCSRLP